MPQSARERASCIYHGQVTHKRLRPFVHSFVYRVFSLYVDLDEIPVLDRRLRWFSHNRWNLFGFHDRDHGARDGSPLRPWIERELASGGIDIAGGPVRVLCFPRVLGYVFNPLSIWFCHHADGRLCAVLYEVSNTFGQSHSYLLPVDSKRPSGAAIVQSCKKAFYVSPFIGMNASYRFRLREPGARLAVSIRESVPEGQQLIATQTGRRGELDDSSLLRVLWAYPLVTLKVIAAIHWQALKLWRRGGTFHRRPPSPDHAVTRAPISPRVPAD